MPKFRFIAPTPTDAVWLAGILSDEIKSLSWRRPSQKTEEVEVTMEIGLTAEELKQIMATLPDGAGETMVKTVEEVR